MYHFELINEEYFDYIVQWKYEEEFACYDMEDRLTTINQLFDQDGYDFFVGLNEFDEIIGYMECFFKDDILEVGHGLNPEIVGQGLSYDFVSNSIEYAIEYYDYTGETVRILVEPFNKRALKVYSRVGFNVVEETDEFIMMDLDT
jgi:RimJ/RimL family protein N-acetyltransferase